MTKTFLMAATACALSLFSNQTSAQGCVAIRGTGSICTKQSSLGSDSKGWQFNTGYRYFKSFRHFVGKEEQKERKERNTEVINWQHTMEFTLARQFQNGWSVALNVPVITNTRSSLYEHGGNSAGPSARHKTRSFGLGDIRLAAYKWILDPAHAMKGNIQLGLGIKLPTGDYSYQDFFIRNDSVKVLGPVDQSIQLGDGGTGFSTEINGYYNFSHLIGVYGNFFYLINPREQNGTSTARGGAISSTALQYGTSTMSVPDQYMIRGGGNLNFKALTLSAGIRMECIPSEDLVGGSSGFRRPGYVLSAEPGFTYSLKKMLIYGSVPIALERNRTQSVADKLRTLKTGTYAHGDAAFADYSINLGCSIKF